MRITQYFFKTAKEAPREAVTPGSRWLYRGGFIRQVSPGQYALLPLGMRVQKKIIQLVEKEFEAVGAQRIDIPVLQAREIGNARKDYTLNEASESLVAEFFGSLKLSYKDLPLKVFFFQPVFRDVAQSKLGLLELREFSMLVACGFTSTEESLSEIFASYSMAFMNIFHKLGLNVSPLDIPGIMGKDAFSRKFIFFPPEVTENLARFWNEGEEMQEMEIVDTSLDLPLFRQIQRIYQNQPEKTIKNMLFEVDNRENICLVLRGDYSIDFIKLRKLLQFQEIRPLSSGEIRELGSCPGFVSSLGLNPKVKVLIDETVKYNKNYWDGSNREWIFRKNVNFGRDLGGENVVDIHEHKAFAVGDEEIMICDRCGHKALLDFAEFLREPVNMEEEIKPLRMIDQPEWVETMDDNLEYYRKPKTHFIKNVVYKDQKGRLIIAVVRGDLEANPVKIARLLECGELVLADNWDLARMGTKAGWVHSWGHDAGRDDIIYVADEVLRLSRNLIGGHKEETRDSINVNYGRDFICKYEGDIVFAYEGAKCKHCQDGYLRQKKGLEVAHSLVHTQSFTSSRGAYFVDRDGREKPLLMGVFKMGLSRLMASAVEIGHDERGIIWPTAIAPFLISLVSIGKSEIVKKVSEQLYEILSRRGWETLWDDRDDASPGAKLTDTDLIGSSIRIIVSERTLGKGCVETKLRTQDKGEYISANEESFSGLIEKISKLASI